MKKIALFTVVLAFAFEASAQVATTAGNTVKLQNGQSVMTQGSTATTAPAPKKATAAKAAKHTGKKHGTKKAKTSKSAN